MRAILTVRVELPEFIKTEKEAEDFLADMDYGFCYTNYFPEDDTTVDRKTIALNTEIQDQEIKL